jgi:gluconate kinase
MLILLTGLPGSGKTTLAGKLADGLDLPLIAKDHFKEILFDTMGIGDRAWSRRIGQAAIALQYDAMATIKTAVVDSALWTGISEPEVVKLGLPLVQVFCQCPFETARDRYFARTRHEGFIAEKMTLADYEQYHVLEEPLRLECPIISVDTSSEVDEIGLIEQLRSYVDYRTEQPTVGVASSS